MGRDEVFEKQLLATFQAELEEHLATLDQGLLAVEQGLSEKEKGAVLEELFRAAHSLKGAARAVKLEDIGTIAHRLEDVLGAIQKEEVSPTAELLDVLFEALDLIREAMTAHRRGEPLAEERRQGLLSNLAAALKGEPTPASAPVAPEPAAPPEAVLEDSVPGPPSDSPPAQGREAGAGREFIRVATEKLDALMDGVGELVVARMRTEQRLGELRRTLEGLTLLEQSCHEVGFPFTRLKREAGPSPAAGPMLDFVTASSTQLKAITAEMVDLLHAFTADYRHLALVTEALQDNVRRARMLPVKSVFDLFPRLIRDLARQRGREVSWRVEGEEVEVDRRVLEAIKDPLIHLVRNAMDHGLEPPEIRRRAGKPEKGLILLRAARQGATIVLEVVDDGTGIDLEAVHRAAVARGLMTADQADRFEPEGIGDLIFHSGLSTLPRATELSGRGVGLDVVRRTLERLNGLVAVKTTPGQGTTFTLTLPLTLATTHVLLAETAGQTMAVPTTNVERIFKLDPAAINSIDGKPALVYEGRPLSLISLARVLELSSSQGVPTPGPGLPVIVLRVAEKRTAFWVDALKGTQEVVIKNLGPQLRRVRNVAGVSVLGTGEVVMILNVADLMKSAAAAPAEAALVPAPAREARRRRLLVVDDSITTRTLEKNILESAGYEVLTAADGLEAWALVQSEPLDAVVADIVMPRLDGFDLTAKVKEDERFREMPVILVTSLETPQDKIRGLEAGADAYITKSAFDQRDLLETIDSLII